MFASGKVRSASETDFDLKLVSGLEKEHKLLLITTSENGLNMKHHRWGKLSNRELQVAQYIIRGYSQSVISTQLGIHYDTVRSTTRNIYQKLGIHESREINILREFIKDFY